MAWLIASSSYRSSFAMTRSRSLSGVKNQQLEPCMEQLIGSRLTKEYDRAVCYHHVFFNIYTEHIMRNARLDELQAGIKIGGKTSTTSDMWMIPF